MSKNERAIDLRGVVKNYGKVRALDGIDLTLTPGEVLGFIGPNGAGKTTTLRILMGMLRADAGEALVFGDDAWSDAVSIHRRVAYVPGDVNLWPSLTGGEVIDFFQTLRGGSFSREERDRWIERFDLDPGKKCGTYSKGNRQKVALVAALASDADLYLLDEPTSGLDPLMEQVFREAVNSLRSRGKSVLLSSHILSEVEKLCDRVSIIRRGRIIETGTLAQLRHLTRSEVVAVVRQVPRDLEMWPGIHDVTMQDAELRFRVDAEQMEGAIARLASCGVLSLECMPPTLEELFMTHYRGDGRESL